MCSKYYWRLRSHPVQQSVQLALEQLDLQKSEGKIKWLCRQVLDLHSGWLAAGKRQGEDWGRGAP